MRIKVISGGQTGEASKGFPCPTCNKLASECTTPVACYDLATKAIAANMAIQQTKLNAKPVPRVGVCVSCEGKITEEFVQRLDSSLGSEIIGPGSESHLYMVSSGLHCTNCGLAYHKLPTENCIKQRAQQEAHLQAMIVAMDVFTKTREP